jgi:hypothetical protein
MKDVSPMQAQASKTEAFLPPSIPTPLPVPTPTPTAKRKRKRKRKKQSNAQRNAKRYKSAHLKSERDSMANK